MSDDTFEVFISYSSRDEVEASRLYGELFDKQWNIFFNPKVREFPGDYAIKLMTHLKQAKVLVILVTENSLVSPEVLDEYNQYRDYAKEDERKRVFIFFGENYTGNKHKDRFYGITQTPMTSDVKTLVQLVRDHIHVKEAPLTEEEQCLSDLQRSQNTGQMFRVGVGCCIWAAPVIRTLFRRLAAEDCALTLYGFEIEANRVMNYWYHGEDCETPQPYALPFEGDGKIQRGNTRRWKGPLIQKAQLFNAGDLLSQVKRGKLDCIVVPSEVYELRSNSDYLKKVASIMHTFQGGCKLLIVSEDETIGESFRKHHIRQDEMKPGSESLANRERFWSFIEQELSQPGDPGQRVKTLLSENTVLEKYYVDLEGYCVQHFGRTLTEGVPIPTLGNWQLLIESVNVLLESERFFLVLIWEPQVSWMINYLRQKKKTVIDLDFLGTFKDFSLPYLSFDIMLSKEYFEKYESEDPDKIIKTINKCLRAIEGSVGDFNNSKNLSRGIERESAALSSFLSIDPDKCRSLLRELNFKFMVYRDWTVEVERLLRSVVQKLQQRCA